MAVTQGMHVRSILFDPCAYLISSADGPVTGDEDIDVVRHALEQPQPNEVVLDRVIAASRSGNGIRTSESMSPATRTPRLLDQQRRMALGMRRMLDDPDFRAIPRNLRSSGGQTGNEAEQVQRYLLGDFRR